MYKAGRQAKSKGLDSMAFFIIWIGRLVSLIAWVFENNILVLVARIATSLVYPV
jgi:hypothetical protein